MSALGRVMYSMRCDHPDGCSAELDNDYGGAWLYDTEDEARDASRDADWVTDGDGKDYCWDHRENVPEYAEANHANGSSE